MTEIMYDIASGANYKFNTAFDGEQVCDVRRSFPLAAAPLRNRNIAFASYSALRSGEISLVVVRQFSALNWPPSPA